MRLGSLNYTDYNYDIIYIISKEEKYTRYLIPEPEPHHFYIDKNLKIVSTCKHLNHIMFYGHNQQNELLGMDARFLFENEATVKKAFRILSNKDEVWNKELLLKRKDKSKFWVLMSFRVEENILFKENQLLCQFININDFKAADDQGQNEPSELKTKLRKKIASSDLMSCISILSQHLNKTGNRDLLNQVLIQESQLNFINRQQRKFIMSLDDYSNAFSKVRSNLIDIIGEI